MAYRFHGYAAFLNNNKSINIEIETFQLLIIL